MTSNYFLNRLVYLRPELALIMVITGVFLFVVFSQQINPSTLSIVIRTIAIAPILAWPCIVVSGLQERYGLEIRAKPKHLWTIFGAIFLDHCLLVPILIKISHDDIVYSFLAPLSWTIGFLVLYICFGRGHGYWLKWKRENVCRLIEYWALSLRFVFFLLGFSSYKGEC